MLGRLLDFKSPYATRRKTMPIWKKFRWASRRWYYPNWIKVIPNLRPSAELVGVKLYLSNVRGTKVQCPSCHDPHDSGVPGDTSTFPRVSQNASALCFACHRI